MALCFKCKKTANIKINILKYCNECFLSNIESKLLKNVPKILSDASVLVYLSDSSSSLVLKEAVENLFQNMLNISKRSENQTIPRILFYSQNTELSLNLAVGNSVDCTFSSENDFNIKRANSDVIKYCLDNKIEILIYGQSLDQTIANSLELLCSGEGTRAVECCSKDQYQGASGTTLLTVNLLNDIKDKEIVYYLFLKNIRRVRSKTPNDSKVNDILSDFLHEIDDKNELAMYNVQSTFKKLYNP